MKLMFILILCFVLIYAEQKSHKPKCEGEGIHVKGKFHRKHIIANGINRPYQLSLYHHHHKIYFSYNVGTDDEDKFEIGYLKKDQKVPTPITEVKNGFATAIDDDRKIVYFGGSEGIYEENLVKPGEIKHVIKGRNIWDLFFRDHLYFIEYPSQRLHKKVDNSSELVEHIHEKIYNFAVDADNDVFITTDTGLHEIKNGTTERIPYTGPNIFRAIEIDHKGVAHFCGQSAIYIPNKHTHSLEEIAHVKNIFGITFDEDNNIIYSDPHEIVKLLPEDYKFGIESVQKKYRTVFTSV